MRKLYYLLSFLLVLFACSKDETVSSEPEPVQTPKYTVSITAGSGGTVSSAGGTYDKDTQISITATPNAEYLFEAWSDGSTDNPRSIKVTADLTITANFVKKQYDLTVNVVGEGAVAEEVVIQGGRYNSGSQIKLTATAAEGWEFSGWSGAVESTDNPVTVNLDGTKEVTATFTRKKFYVTVNVEGEGTYLLTPQSEDGYEFGSEVSIDIEANEEWYLDNVEVIFDCDEGDESCATAYAILQALLAAQTNYNRIEFTIYANISINIYFVRDRDSDGVPDIKDNCPLEGGDYIGDDGCPMPPIYLDENGITIKAQDWAQIGDTWEVNGVTYRIVSESELRGMISNKSDISKVCTSKITNMSSLLSFTEFNRDISSWDVSNVTDMTELFISSYFDGDISNWDVSNVNNMSYMFAHTYFNGDISNWDVSNVNNMSYMFAGNIRNSSNDQNRSEFNGDISNWDVSNVIDMSGMFWRSTFTGDISEWDTYNVKDMSLLFAEAEFNGDISNWDVSNVEDFAFMFSGSTKTIAYETYPELNPFKNDISNWNVSGAKSMNGMFYASSFDGDISSWDVSNVTDMSKMFLASYFNGDISKWDVSNVIDMSGMFGSSIFTGDISSWDVSNVTDMSSMFGTSKFNGDISGWDVSNVVTMYGMFAGIGEPFTEYRNVFNGDISSWDVSNVTDMTGMFYLSSFDRDISTWNVSNVIKMSWMFSSSFFNQDLSDWDVQRVVECQDFSKDNAQWTLPKPNFTNCSE